MSLSRWFPAPTAVKVAGRVALASELRVRDLAALEAYIAAVLVSPLHGLDEAAEDYPERLREAYDLAAEWPPGIDSPHGLAALFADPAGLALFVSLALRDSPEIDPEAVAAAIDQDELAALAKVAFGDRPDWRPVVVRAIDDHLGLPAFEAREDRGEAATVSWSRAVGETLAGDPSRLAALGDMTPGQVALLRAGGEAEDKGDPMPADDALTDAVTRARYRFWHGKEMPEATTAEADPDAGLLDGPPLPEGWISGDEGEWEAGF